MAFVKYEDEIKPITSMYAKDSDAIKIVPCIYVKENDTLTQLCNTLDISAQITNITEPTLVVRIQKTGRPFMLTWEDDQGVVSNFINTPGDQYEYSLDITGTSGILTGNGIRNIILGSIDGDIVFDSLKVTGEGLFYQSLMTSVTFPEGYQPTDCHSMFENTGVILMNDLDTSQATTFVDFMLYNEWDTLPDFDFSSGINFTSAWRYSAVIDFPAVDFPAGTLFNYAWGDSAIESFGACTFPEAINCEWAWRSCLSLTSFPAIDFDLTTNFNQAWALCDLLTSFGVCTFPRGENFEGTWKETSISAFPDIDFTSGTNFEEAWYRTGLSTFTSTRFTSALNLDYAWYGNLNLAGIAGHMTTGNVTSALRAFDSTGLVAIPDMDLTSLLIANHMFTQCDKLEHTYDLSLPVAEDLGSMFAYCDDLLTIGDINAPLATDWSSFSRVCLNLQCVGVIGSGSLTHSPTMFYSCKRLTSIRAIDTSNATSSSSMLADTDSLAGDTLANKAGIEGSPGIDFVNSDPGPCKYYKEFEYFVDNYTSTPAIVDGPNFIDGSSSTGSLWYYTDGEVLTINQNCEYDNQDTVGDIRIQIHGVNYYVEGHTTANLTSFIVTHNGVSSANLASNQLPGTLIFQGLFGLTWVNSIFSIEMKYTGTWDVDAVADGKLGISDTKVQVTNIGVPAP